MPRDNEQIEAIQTSHNVVVRAGAGAGKTSVLVERYVRLVADGTPVDRILTLTFTRKAAAEMHERIHDRLGERAASGDLLASRELARLDTAVISTLDAFCATVARTGCADRGVPPTFSVDEDAVARFSEHQALNFLMSRVDREHVDWEGSAAKESILSLVRLNRFEPLWRGGFARLARDHFLVGSPLDLEDHEIRQRRFLLDHIESRAGEIVAQTAAISSLDARAARCIERARSTIEAAGFSAEAVSEVVSLLAAHDGREPLDETSRRQTDDVVTRVRQLAGIGIRCGASKHADVAELKARVQELRSSTEYLIEALLTLRAWHEVAAALQVAAEFQSVVIAEKRRRGLLSYHDVVTLAIAILRDDLDIRRHFKSRFDSIMIDEFQDNNDEQKQLLYLLAEKPGSEQPGIPAASDLDPGKLFFVGDEKQSIYRFRGADVSVFKGLDSDLGSRAEAITLRHNYRSEPGLITFFNALFPRVFDNPEPGYEAAFTPLLSRDAVPGLKPSVQLWNVEAGDDPDLLHPDDTEAYAVARFIRDTVNQGALSVPAGSNEPVTVRPVEYRDFAILLRSTGNQLRFERMLRLLAVPYQSQTARSLFLEAPVNDMYSILQLVLYPQDRAALAAYLRSPLVAMSDDGIVRVFVEEGELFEPVAGLSAADQECYAIANTRYLEMCALADTQRLTDLIHHIWYVWGYRYHLARDQRNHPYLEHYDYVYELARQHEQKGLAAFLHTIRESAGRNERVDELTVLGNQTAGVQIMTIHKAKGLEFPVVILANTGNRGRSDRISDAPFYRSERGLVFNTSADTGSPKDRAVNAIYRIEKERARQEDRAELRRLLYVAATRATTHLVISGRRRGNDQSMLSLLHGPFAAALDELEESDQLDISELSVAPVPNTELYVRSAATSWDMESRAAEYQNQRPEGAPDARLLHRRVFTVTELNAAHRETAFAGAQKQLDFLGDAKTDGHETLFGTYVHYCIEQLGQGRSESFVTNPAMVPASARPDVSPDDLRRFLADGLKLAAGFLDSETWSSLRDLDVSFELPFMMRLDLDSGAIRVRGKMDLVAVGREKVTIIDFKTDRNLETDHYALQLELYRKAATSIFSRPAETSLYDLRHGRALPVTMETSVERLSGIVRDILESERTS